MSVIVESTLPIFLIILIGHLLRRFLLTEKTAWEGVEVLGYWVLYPALLFTSIFDADFSGLRLDAMMMSLLGAVLFMMVVTALLWPLFDRLGLISSAEYSSVFQTSIRWNSFIALAIAEKLFGAAGVAVVALAMAVIIVPINIACVSFITRVTDRAADWRRIARGLATNPLILGTLAGIAARFLPHGLYGPAYATLGLLGEAALGAGLLAIGAGLRTGDLVRPRLAAMLPVGLKLVFFPAVMIAIAHLAGIQGLQLSYLALCAAVPTAMNGYLLARQLGGDAELYASVTTLQTIVSFATIPAVLAAAAYVSSG